MALIVADASILIALLDSGDAHHPRATEALAHAWDTGDDVVVPASAYAETMVGPVRSGGKRLATAEAFFAVQRVEPVSRSIGRRAAELRARHPSLRLPDALTIATGFELSAQAILTADSRWRGVGGPIRIIPG